MYEYKFMINFSENHGYGKDQRSFITFNLPGDRELEYGPDTFSNNLIEVSNRMKPICPTALNNTLNYSSLIFFI